MPKERPLYVGRTSKWSLNIDAHIIAMAVSLLFTVVFFICSVLLLVIPETIEEFMTNNAEAMLYVIIGISVAMIFALTAAVFLSTRAQLELFGGIVLTAIVIFLVIFLSIVVACFVVSDLITGAFVTNGRQVINTAKWVSLGVTAVSLAFAFMTYMFMLRRISSAQDDGRRVSANGEANADGRRVFPNNARNLTADMRNHNRIAYIVFKVYSDRIVVTDFTGWREWVYLIAGVYQIRVLQTWFGKAFNYGDVVLRSMGSAGEIRFLGIKDPHAFKAIFEKKIKTGAVSLGGILPSMLNDTPGIQE